MATREPLTRDRIVATAVALADDEGLDALSMRKLAALLGYEPMSLYNHIENKDDLLAGMAEAVGCELVLDVEVVGEGSWRDAVHAVLTAAREALLSHPWATALWEQVLYSPGGRRWMDGLLGCFRGAGFSVELAHHGFHAMNLYVVGTVEQTLSFQMPDDPEAAMAQFLAATPEDEYPHLVEHVRYHAEEGTVDEDDFELLLDVILDGLERRATVEAAS